MYFILPDEKLIALLSTWCFVLWAEAQAPRVVSDAIVWCNDMALKKGDDGTGPGYTYATREIARF